MENEKVIIKSFAIKSFRNIASVSYNTHDKSVVFAGTNHIGKTNILNAIYWCLCGVTLDNSSNDRANIPYSLKDATLVDGNFIVDVIVFLNTGSIRRVLTWEKGSVKQHIYINGYETETLKDGEVQIDEMLGILPILTKKFDGVNLRRLLLNPMYVYQITESSLREVITNIIDNEELKRQAFAELPFTIKAILENLDLDASNLSKRLTRNIKNAKSELDKLNYTKEFLLQNCDNKKALDRCETLISEQLNKITENTEKSVALDSYVLNLNKLYDKVVREQFPTIEIKLLEKGIGEDVWKEKCQVIMDNGISAFNGSTSEKMLIALQFLNAFINKFDNVNKLPILLDELETFDELSVETLKAKNDLQIISSKVLNKSNGLEMEVL